MPFEYRAALYKETFNGGGAGGHIDARSRGIEFWPPADPGATVVSQQRMEITSASDRRTMAAFRFLIDHPSGTDAFFGLIETNSDPFGSYPQNGIFFFHRRSPVTGSLDAVTVSEGNEPTVTSDLLDTAENTFYDVALIWHKVEVAEFVVLRSGRQWASYVHDANVPSTPLRLTFAAINPSSNGGLVIRGCSVHLQEFS